MEYFITLITSIFGQASILVGLIACLGLIFQKASLERIITGSIKAFLGMLIMISGAGVVVDMLSPMAEIMAEGFGFQGVVPVNEAITALATTKFGSQMALITIGSFFVNVLLAKISPLKYIFLSGHHILFISTVTTAMLFTLGLSDIQVIIYGSLISGIVMTCMPALAMPIVHKVTNGAGFTIGHLSTLGYVSSAIIGKFAGGDPVDKSAEKIEFTGKLGFMRESLILMGLGVFFVYIISAIMSGRDFVSHYSQQLDPYIWVFIQSFIFAAGVAIILQGVRMFISELIPAFKGISDKIVLNSVPALDCPTIFPFAEKSVLIGFMGYTIGLIAAMIVMLLINSPIVIIPILFNAFFIGGTAGVFGNATGGARGALLGSIFVGFFNSVIQGLLYIEMINFGFKGLTFVDTDFVLVGLLISKFGSIMPLVLGIFILLFVISIVIELKITRSLVNKTK